MNSYTYDAALSAAITVQAETKEEARIIVESLFGGGGISVFQHDGTAITCALQMQGSPALVEEQVDV